MTLPPRRVTASLEPAVPGGTLEVLVTSRRRFRQVGVRQLFGTLNCCHITPIRDLRRVLAIIRCNYRPFSLIIVGTSVTNRALNLRKFLLSGPRIHRTLIFGTRTQHSPVPTTKRKGIRIDRTVLPSRINVRQLVTTVSPPYGSTSRP